MYSNLERLKSCEANEQNDIEEKRLTVPRTLLSVPTMVVVSAELQRVQRNKQ